MTATLRHGRIQLALHELADRPGRPLLLLHGLGEQSPAAAPTWTDPWPGPVLALDFTGHGQSTIPHGGGYSCEVLMGDVDAVLAARGPLTIHGRGLGAYIALLIAGARPAEVRGAILADGPGLAGGGPGPSSPRIVAVHGDGSTTPDPWALAELALDVRPPDYATSFARQATHLSGQDSPVAVAAVVRPPWIEAILSEPGVVELPVEAAVAAYAQLD